MQETTQECDLCPSSCFCVGGATPHTPCPGELFSPPGAESASSCTPVVFVIVTLSIPIIRVEFNSVEEFNLQSAIAAESRVNTGLIVIFSVSDSTLAGWIEVVIKIASPNATSAQSLSSALNSSSLSTSLAAGGFPKFILESIQVTACPEGFELSSTDECQACPANYYWLGGTTSRVSCPTGTFSLPATNSSASCLPLVVVQVTISLPMTEANFDAGTETRFVMAFAASLGVSSKQVVIVSVDGALARRAASSIQVLTEVLCENTGTAATVSGRINSNDLNSQLVSHGLPQCTVQAVSIIGGTTAAAGTPTSVIIGSSIGCLILFGMLSTGGYYMTLVLLKYYATRAFLAAIRGSKAGDEATEAHLPYALRAVYEGRKVLGKGAFGCVLHAVTKKGGKEVAIKLIPSEHGGFSAKENRQVDICLSFSALT